MASAAKELAIVTGASSGIGFELAKLAAGNGFDLVVAADEPEIHTAAERLRQFGRSVEVVEADLSTFEGVDQLVATAESSGEKIGLLMANAGRGLGKGFLDQDVEAWRKVVDTNVTGTLYLIHKIGRTMRTRNAGRILITGSIAGFMPGSFQAVYNGTKAFIHSFSFALRNELEETGVTVTCLMPGPTDTEFFARADLLDTKIGAGKKDDPAEVARIGFEAMMNGEGDIVSGWKNKIQAALATVTPSSVLAEQHRKMAAPGTAKS